ncbi:glucose-methanol-choline oxidoreductase [Actinobacteria bacterium OK074]|nr:glucose-methanol-choline oxidoreductase [Actinobacteria bacterium OK074]
MILSAGTIGSAHLLLLSGIGPADDLRAMGIDVTADLPGMGANLHDHALAPVVYESSRRVPRGTSDKIEAQYFAQTDPPLPAPDLQPVMSHVPLPAVGVQVPEEGHGYTIALGTIRTLSLGRLWLRSPGPAVVIDTDIAAYVKRNLPSYHPPGRHLPHGHGPRHGRRPPTPGPRHPGPARGGRLGQAGRAVGEHACGLGDGWGAVCGVFVGRGLSDAVSREGQGCNSDKVVRLKAEADGPT